MFISVSELFETVMDDMFVALNLFPRGLNQAQKQQLVDNFCISSRHYINIIPQRVFHPKMLITDVHITDLIKYMSLVAIHVPKEESIFYQLSESDLCSIVFNVLTKHNVCITSDRVDPFNYRHIVANSYYYPDSGIFIGVGIKSLSVERSKAFFLF